MSDNKTLVTTPKVEELAVKGKKYYKKTDWKGEVQQFIKKKWGHSTSYVMDKLRDGEEITNTGNIIKDYSQRTKDLIAKERAGIKLTQEELKEKWDDVLTKTKTQRYEWQYQQEIRDINRGIASTNEHIEKDPITGKYTGNLYIPSRTNQFAVSFLKNPLIVDVVGRMKNDPENSYEKLLPEFIRTDPYGFKNGTQGAVQRLQHFLQLRKKFQLLESIVEGNYREQTPEGEEAYATERGFAEYSYKDVLDNYSRASVKGLWKSIYKPIQILMTAGMKRDAEANGEKVEINENLFNRVLYGTGSEENTNAMLQEFTKALEGLNRARTGHLKMTMFGEVDPEERKYVKMYEYIKKKMAPEGNSIENLLLENGEQTTPEAQQLQKTENVKKEKTYKEEQEEIKKIFEEHEKKTKTPTANISKLVEQASKNVARTIDEEEINDDDGERKARKIVTFAKAGLFGLAVKAVKTAWKSYQGSYYAKLAGDRTGYFERQIQGVLSIYTTKNAMKEEDNWHYKSRGEMELTGLEQGDGLLQYIGGSSTMTKEQKNKLADNFIKRKQMTPLQARAFKRRLHLEQQDSAEKGNAMEIITSDVVKNGILKFFSNAGEADYYNDIYNIIQSKKGDNTTNNITENTTNNNITEATQEGSVFENIFNNTGSIFNINNNTQTSQPTNTQPVKESSKSNNKSTNNVTFNSTGATDNLSDVIKDRLTRTIQNYLTNR